MKRIAIFVDGTLNVVELNTNVWRLKCLCKKIGDDGIEQTSYYDKGLGTTYGEIFRGQVFGYGIDDAVRHAYEWLMEQYEQGDEIFIFGFSRGGARTQPTGPKTWKTGQKQKRTN
jgi:uncharacterized protein (DUF2235 family)